MFLLMYYGGFAYTEARKLPIPYRRWFIERINKEFAKSQEAGEGQSRAAHHNTPTTRAMQGRARENVPARMARFT